MLSAYGPQGAPDLGFAFLVPLAVAGVGAASTAWAAHKAGKEGDAQRAALVAQGQDADAAEKRRIAAELLAIDAKQRQTTGLMFLVLAGGLTGLAILT